jgi:sporulation protein YlmC with PRC-barrel domain
MKSTLERMAICLATAFCAQMLLAAQQTGQAQGQPSGQPPYPSTQTAASTNGNIRLSKLIGAKVKSKNGEDLGKLEDVLVDPQTGRPTFAILGQGGTMGLGEKRRPVPWQELQINSEKQMTLNMDKQKFSSAPTTASSDYSDLNDPQQVVVIYEFYESAPSGAPGATPGGTQGGSSQSPPSPSQPKSGGGSNP